MIKAIYDDDGGDVEHEGTRTYRHMIRFFGYAVMVRLSVCSYSCSCGGRTFGIRIRNNIFTCQFIPCLMYDVRTHSHVGAFNTINKNHKHFIIIISTTMMAVVIFNYTHIDARADARLLSFMSLRHSTAALPSKFCLSFLQLLHASKYTQILCRR